MPPRPRRSFVLLRLVSLLFLGGLFLILYLGTGLLPAGAKKEPQEFVVRPGETVGTVIRALKEAHLLRSSLAFRFLIGRRTIQAGSYFLSPAMPGWQMVQILSGGGGQKIVVTLPEGFTTKEIVARLVKAGLLKEEEWEKLLLEVSLSDFAWLPPDARKFHLEGFLFPDTYFFTPQTSAEEILKSFLTNFQKRTAPLKPKIEGSGLALKELVILASLVEREGRKKEEMELIASVLLNRLQASMRLDVDASIRFLLDKWDAPLTQEDLKTPSPYNTRLFPGLPPGAIGNPGLKAIRAALDAPKSDYYYYLTAPSGQTYFTRTLEEHNQQKARYLP